MPCCAPPSTHIVNRGCDGAQDIFEGLELTGRDLRKEKSTLNLVSFTHSFSHSIMCQTPSGTESQQFTVQLVRGHIQETAE